MNWILPGRDRFIYKQFYVASIWKITKTEHTVAQLLFVDVIPDCAFFCRIENYFLRLVFKCHNLLGGRISRESTFPERSRHLSGQCNVFVEKWFIFQKVCVKAHVWILAIEERRCENLVALYSKKKIEKSQNAQQKRKRTCKVCGVRVGSVRMCIRWNTKRQRCKRV